MRTSNLAWIGLLSIFGAWLGCGGDVVVEPGTGGGGPTSSGNANTTSTSGVSSGVTTTSTISVSSSSGTGGDCALPGTPDPLDCTTACLSLYDCGVVLCEGVPLCKFANNAADLGAFMYDPMFGCVPGCMETPALVNVVDPSDCKVTISTIKSASPQFADLCDNGVGTP